MSPVLPIISRGQSLLVGDLKMPEGVTLKDDPHTTVFAIVAAKR